MVPLDSVLYHPSTNAGTEKELPLLLRHRGWQIYSARESFDLISDFHFDEKGIAHASESSRKERRNSQCTCRAKRQMCALGGEPEKQQKLPLAPLQKRSARPRKYLAV